MRGAVVVVVACGGSVRRSRREWVAGWCRWIFRLRLDLLSAPLLRLRRAPSGPSAVCVGVTLLSQRPAGPAGDVWGEGEKAGQEDEEPAGQCHLSCRAGVLSRRREQSLPDPRYGRGGWSRRECSPAPSLRTECPRPLRPARRAWCGGVPGFRPLPLTPLTLILPQMSLICASRCHPFGYMTGLLPPTALSSLKMNSVLHPIRWLPSSFCQTWEALEEPV